MNNLAKMVKDAQKGDGKAIEKLVDAHQESLLKFCFFLVQDFAVAQDLCQSSFVKALQNIGQLHNPDSFKFWLFKIAKNQFLDLKKSPKNPSANTVYIPEENLPVQQLCDYEEICHVSDVLSHLGNDERLVLLLVCLEGYSYREVAEMLEVSEDVVRSRLHRSRTHFIENYSNESGSQIVLQENRKKGVSK